MILTARTIITGDGKSVLRDGAVLIRDGIIRAVGLPEEIRASNPAESVTVSAIVVKEEKTLVDENGSSREKKVFILPGNASVHLGDKIIAGGGGIFSVTALKVCRSVDAGESYLRADAVR